MFRNILPDGTLLDDETYRIEYPLGKGGFGITYFAHDLHLDRAVAIKEFFPEALVTRDIHGKLIAADNRRKQFDRAVRRFYEEGRVLAKINHQGVVRVYRLFRAHDTVYLVMEFLEGQTLRDMLNALPLGKMSLEQTQALCYPLINALETIHRQSVYHLDLKPENIQIAPDLRPVLIDFGSARRGSHVDTYVTYSEAYAPPELIENNEVGPESDWYQLGVVLFELITGKTPPNALSRRAGITWSPHALDEPWRTLVDRCLCLEQRNRPHSAREVIAILEDPVKFTVKPDVIAHDIPKPPPSKDRLEEPPWYLQPDIVDEEEEPPWYLDPLD